MSSHCECAGKYTTMNPQQDFIKKLQILEAISEHYHMPILSQVVEWNLQMNK